ncbi:hypothetical protein D6D17_08795 [Aureobasidium pullulans]|nr:hypothetical protein D6D17_08795 [Aureobasidium pullulans]
MQDLVSAINIPDVDVWQLLFEQPKEFSRHKNIYINHATSAAYSFENVKQQAIKFGSILLSRWS